MVEVAAVVRRGGVREDLVEDRVVAANVVDAVGRANGERERAQVTQVVEAVISDQPGKAYFQFAQSWEESIERLHAEAIEATGRRAVQRDTLYRVVRRY